MESTRVIASGNLATQQRTITGVMGQFVQMEVPDQEALHIVLNAGLPASALEAPDFPISLQQELEVVLGIVRWMGEQRSPVTNHFLRWHDLGIEYIGVLGMMMRHAATALQAVEAAFMYPQLIWGHSRLVISRRGELSLFSFHVTRPHIRDASERDIDRLVQHCLAQDVVASARNIQDITASIEPPRAIRFEFPEPPDWDRVRDKLPCPVEFSCEETCIVHPGAVDDTPLPRANPHLFRSYQSIAERLSQTLSGDHSLSEQVRRLLWAHTPPLKRAEIAALLAMSERNLTRQLGSEGTSYADLLAGVQEARAKHFLRNPRLTVGEIGYRLGYSEPAAFTRAFSGWTGQSPLKWRQGQAA